MAKKLETYRRKRRFDKTPEPAGRARREPGPLRFVVHLHDATRLHYDLRLEMDGVFKSWAVPKGPSLNPTEQRLAVFVEDHPLDYGKFEGIIPEGNYGAGPVILWDSGTYRERRAQTRKESEAALLLGLKKGHITFVLDGEKLKGEFALVRMKDTKNWLLIKKGDAYSSYRKVDWDPRSVLSRQTLDHLHDKKGAAKAKRWISNRSASGAPKKAAALPRIRLMVPLRKREAPSGKQWLFQSFGEGTRVFVEVENGEARILSRARVPLSRRYPDLVKILKTLPKTAILDGEILGDQFRVLDLLFIDGKDLREETLKARLQALSKLRLPKGVELAPRVKGAQESGWVARDQGSVYASGLTRDWVRGGKLAAIAPRLTHLDKKIWPKEGYTKKDLTEYYRTVASVVLPYLKDRPLSLHRFPNGIEETGFYQKDLTGHLPPSVETFAHYSPSSGRTIHYALAQDEASLLYLANLACIELNPWMSRTQNIDDADYCVIDLDPDGNKFSEVVKVALAYKKILDRIGVKAFCKTSGATGLHIWVPWKAGTSFDTSRAFAIAISEQVLEQFPTLTSMVRSPGKRRGKIYLDCFQNARGQTVVAPYSLRPNPGAPVSTPLDWKELTPKLDPSVFTLKTVPTRLAKRGDLWKGLFENAHSADKLLKKLK